MKLEVPAIRVNPKAPVEILQSQVLENIDSLLEEVDEEVLRRKEQELLAKGKIDLVLLVHLDDDLPTGIQSNIEFDSTNIESNLESGIE